MIPTGWVETPLRLVYPEDEEEAVEDEQYHAEGRLQARDYEAWADL